MVNIYTPSGLFIANNILVSCKAEKDGSEYFLAPFRILAKYVHNQLP
jgi:hypothetical protein